MRLSVVATLATGGHYGDYVLAGSQAIMTLSAEITEELRRLIPSARKP